VKRVSDGQAPASWWAQEPGHIVISSGCAISAAARVTTWLPLIVRLLRGKLNAAIERRDSKHFPTAHLPLAVGQMRRSKFSGSERADVDQRALSSANRPASSRRDSHGCEGAGASPAVMVLDGAARCCVDCG
jgi:hypothetical protein